jgi:hypothetical protein
VGSVGFASRASSLAVTEPIPDAEIARKAMGQSPAGLFGLSCQLRPGPEEADYKLLGQRITYRRHFFRHGKLVNRLGAGIMNAALTGSYFPRSLFLERCDISIHGGDS